jgi:hypothetical protein
MGNTIKPLKIAQKQNIKLKTGRGVLLTLKNFFQLAEMMFDSSESGHCQILTAGLQGHANPWKVVRKMCAIKKYSNAGVELRRQPIVRKQLRLCQRGIDRYQR